MTYLFKSLAASSKTHCSNNAPICNLMHLKVGKVITKLKKDNKYPYAMYK